MSFETVLASERVYEGRILNLRVDEIRTPTGAEALREIVENGGAVAIVALDDRQRVVLVKQYRHAVRSLVSEIREVKHPYQKGFVSRVGIDY